MKVKILVAALAVAALSISNVHAATITNIVGDNTRTADGDATGLTLTGGFISGNQSWSHTGYGVLNIADIISATLDIDTIDADGGFLRITAGGSLVGDAAGTDSGVPGAFHPLSGDAPNVQFDLSTFFADIADGTFALVGTNNSMSIWGSNRAILTINTVDPPITDPVPEPSTLLLLGTGLVGLVGYRRRNVA